MPSDDDTCPSDLCPGLDGIERKKEFSKFTADLSHSLVSCVCLSSPTSCFLEYQDPTSPMVGVVRGRVTNWINTTHGKVFPSLFKAKRVIFSFSDRVHSVAQAGLGLPAILLSQLSVLS